MAKFAKLEPDYTFLEPELTDKEQRFVDEYFVDLDRVRAFRAAGYTAKDDDVAAARVASMLKRPQIIAAIRKRQEANAASLATLSPLSVMEKNLRYWFKIAEQDVTGDDGEPDADKVKEARMARVMAQEVAKQAAPYCHPRLQSIVHSGDPNNPVNVQVTKIERRIIAAPARSEDDHLADRRGNSVRSATGRDAGNDGDRKADATH